MKKEFGDVTFTWKKTFENREGWLHMLFALLF